MYISSKVKFGQMNFLENNGISKICTRRLADLNGDGLIDVIEGYNFGTGFVEGSSAVINPIAGAIGGIISKTSEKLYEGESINSFGDLLDIGSEGAFNSVSGILGEKFLPKVGESRIKYLSSFFTTKTGQRFAENKLVENIGITYSQKAYNYFSNSFSLPNVNQISDNANRAQANSRESSNGGGSRSSVTTADRSRASRQISSAQSSEFIQISSGFARLASSLGVSVSTSNHKKK